MFAGLELGGRAMAGSILGKLVSKSLPSSGLLSAVVVSTVMLLILTLLKLPVSLSNCTVGAFVGAALGSSTGVKIPALIEIVGSWIAVPFACAFLSFVIYEIVVRLEENRSLVSVIRANRIALVLVVFLVSFILGANNLGLMESFVVNAGNPVLSSIIVLLLFSSAALGIVIFGKLIAQVVGDEIVGLSQIKTSAAMLAATVLILILTAASIPVSLTQVIIGGMLGAGVSRRPWAINSKEIGVLISSWALVTLICAGLGFLVSHFA
jgi:inorganic phosphate transporter, PiT family